MKQNEEKIKKQQKKHKVVSFKNFPYDFIIITGALPMWLYLRPKIYRMSKEKIKGAAIVMANHVGLLEKKCCKAPARIKAAAPAPNRRIGPKPKKSVQRAQRPLFLNNRHIPQTATPPSPDLFRSFRRRRAVLLAAPKPSPAAHNDF